MSDKVNNYHSTGKSNNLIYYKRWSGLPLDMEIWKKFFQSSGVDLWALCERALTVAYIEDPDGFPVRRDKLAQKLFAPEKLDLEIWEKDAPLVTLFDLPNRHETKCLHSQDLQKGELSSEDGDWTFVDNAYDEAEVLTEEMEEEILVKRGVLGIKEILQDTYQSDKEILDSLQRLDLMQLSVDVLKDTKIGKAVNSLRKHPSKRVRTMAKRLVSGWKDLVEEWVKSAKDVAAAATSAETPASSSPVGINEEHGLASPPMDEGALLATRPESIDMSQLFDFLDDDISAGFGGTNSPEDNHQQSAMVDLKKPYHNYILPELHFVRTHSRDEQISAARYNSTRKDLEMKETEEWRSLTTLNRYSEKEIDQSIKKGRNGINRITNIFSNERLHRNNIEKASSGHSQRVQMLKSGSRLAHRKGDPEYDEKMQATKRKLQKNYQQAENAKKQRTIQVMDLQDLPKGGSNRAKSFYLAHRKPNSQHRLWSTGQKWTVG